MSPTVFREGGYRFFFFSREEPRIHIHVTSADGEVKFWVEPDVTLAVNHGLSDKEIAKVEKVVRKREDEIREAWNRHFTS